MATLPTVEIQVTETTVQVVQDADRRRAIGLLVDIWVRSGAPDPLALVLHATQAAARMAGITVQDVEGELARYNAERRC